MSKSHPVKPFRPFCGDGSRLGAATPTAREAMSDHGDAAALEDAFKDDLLDAGILANIYLLGVRAKDLYAGLRSQPAHKGT